METMERTGTPVRDQRFWHPLGLAFKAVAMAMAAVTIAFVILAEGDAGTYATFLAIGLFAMAIGSMMDHRRGPDR
jgi:cell division protein FtsW (lipid II flippase)